MRKFSDFEKKVLDLIIKLFNNNQTVCAENILFDLEGIFGLSITCGFHVINRNDELELVYNSQRFSTQEDFKNLFYDKIAKLYEYYLLMKYLEENEYIFLAEADLCVKQDDICDTTTDFIKPSLSKKLKPYFSSYYYPTSKLYNMVENDYLDLEAQKIRKEEIKQQKKEEEDKIKQYKLEIRQNKSEKRQKVQYWTTTIIAVASFIISLLTLFVPISIKKGNVDINISDIKKEPIEIEVKNIEQKKALPIKIDEPIELEKQDPIPINVNVTVNKEFPK